MATPHPHPTPFHPPHLLSSLSGQYFGWLEPVLPDKTIFSHCMERGKSYTNMTAGFLLASTSFLPCQIYIEIINSCTGRVSNLPILNSKRKETKRERSRGGGGGGIKIKVCHIAFKETSNLPTLNGKGQKHIKTSLPTLHSKRRVTSHLKKRNKSPTLNSKRQKHIRTSHSTFNKSTHTEQ